jgi:hypothetical protein
LSPSFATAAVLCIEAQNTEYRQLRSETPQCKWHRIASMTQVTIVELA